MPDPLSAPHLPSPYQPFERIAGKPGSTLVLLADHATNIIPDPYGDLGLPPEAFNRHIAYDIGIDSLTRLLAEKLQCPAVLSRFSRLLVDPNRGEDDPTLVMKISDGAIIPGNHPITDEEWNRRITRFHRPYHDAVSATIAESDAYGGTVPLVLSLHSFTPFWKGVPRPWHAAVLWDSDARAARPLIDALSAESGLLIGDNEPYDGALRGDTLYRHCMRGGIPHALLEVRQDLIADEAGVTTWAERLVPVFHTLDLEPSLHRREIHPSRTGPY